MKEYYIIYIPHSPLIFNPRNSKRNRNPQNMAYLPNGAMGSTPLISTIEIMRRKALFFYLSHFSFSYLRHLLQIYALFSPI